MNLYFRLFWTLLRAFWLPKLTLTAQLEREFRVLPNDIDVNLHMNNGRYLTIADLMIVEFFARTGFLKTLIRNRWKPVLGGSIITYRRQLKLGEKYKVRYHWIGSDARWNYLAFKFIGSDGRLSASGYCKGAAVSRMGLVTIVDAFAAWGTSIPDVMLPDAVLHWKECEADLLI
ncbi:thioesterase family protein [Palleronia abyssalis]|uniref:Thioesterase domain-containing protein n=1 Tax=Palleronia abyssalis TaxID=1501240 RepID=A0A2R8BS42_9RHOB|nr:thioesterase family protein [Palleronia abyssalis]SPJ22958.1 hypothetical protein PAA8504_00759 [Palleronia abyssalis]